MNTLLLSHRACLGHDPGAEHPECPDRLRAVLEALESEEFAALLRAEAPAATPEQLGRVHPQGDVEAILGIRPAEGERVALEGELLRAGRLSRCRRLRLLLLL
jgi:acetoin utilization deacetylase AcuC-like enzyme